MKLSTMIFQFHGESNSRVRAMPCSCSAEGPAPSTPQPQNLRRGAASPIGEGYPRRPSMGGLFSTRAGRLALLVASLAAISAPVGWVATDALGN